LVGIEENVVRPQPVPDLLPSDELSSTLYQEDQNIEWLLFELHRSPGAPEFIATEVELALPEEIDLRQKKARYAAREYTRFRTAASVYLDLSSVYRVRQKLDKKYRLLIDVSRCLGSICSTQAIAPAGDIKGRTG